MTPRPIVAVGVVVVSVALLGGILGFGLTRDPRAVPFRLAGEEAPPFDLRTLDGRRTVRLGDLKGRVVAVNFWASWCAECRIEHPALAAAWRRFRDRGVVLLGIPFQDDPAASREYLDEYGGGWPILEDPGSRTALAYGVYGVPETVFIGRDGRVAGRVVGPVRYEDLTRWFRRLLGEGGS
ncbi:MAG TPA: TlpA disulfide reductase family protein [Actinomycetota bacterium]|nr:TlpA disulfide reductase family protein [Actinomycetota bacterium]